MRTNEVVGNKPFGEVSIEDDRIKMEVPPAQEFSLERAVESLVHRIVRGESSPYSSIAQCPFRQDCPGGDRGDLRTIIQNKKRLPLMVAA